MVKQRAITWIAKATERRRVIEEQEYINQLNKLNEKQRKVCEDIRRRSKGLPRKPPVAAYGNIIEI